MPVVGIESVDVVVRISTPHINDAVNDGGRGDNITSRRVPVVGIESVDVVVIAPHINDAVNDGRRGFPTFHRVIPELVPVVGIEGKEVVSTPHINDAVNDGGTGAVYWPSRVVPLQHSIRLHRPRHGAVIAGARDVISKLHRIGLCC